MNQSRHPAGVPIGGQFAASERNEADVTLRPMTEDDIAFARETLGPDATPEQVWGLAEMRADSDDREIGQSSQTAEDPCWVCGKEPHDLQGTYPDGHVYRPRSEVIAAMDRQDYDDSRKSVEHDWHLLTDKIEMLPEGERQARYESVADHFESVAREAANKAPANALPAYGQTELNKHTGVVYAAAEYAAQARLNAGAGPFRVVDIEAGGDRLAMKSFDTRDFTAANGVPFRARIVRRGAYWGRTGASIAQQDMVFFFDARYPDFPPMIGDEHEDRERTERNGQHVANYTIGTLRDIGPGSGLDLYGGEPDWKIDGSTFADIRAWMERRARS